MTTLNIIFGQKVKEFRKAKGYSQASLSRMILNVENKGYISEMELGKKNVTLATIEKVMQALDMEIEFKFTAVAKPPQSELA